MGAVESTLRDLMMGASNCTYAWTCRFLAAFGALFVAIMTFQFRRTISAAHATDVFAFRLMAALILPGA